MKIKAYLEANYELHALTDSYFIPEFQAKNKAQKPHRKDDSKSKERKVDYNKQRELKRTV
jgi:hypothetical protein